MRIGEILLRNGWVDEQSLRQALVEQRDSGKRLCSLLIVRGVLDPDHASRALAEQHGVAAALARHLEHRERPLARLMPAAIARAHCALPIGRMRDGEVIICVRDPKLGQQEEYEHLLNKAVVIAVAPAQSLEPLVEIAYQPGTTAEFGVRFSRSSTQPATAPAPPPPTASFASGTERPMRVSPPATPPAPSAADIFAIELEPSDGAVEGIDVDLETGPNPVPAASPAGDAPAFDPDALPEVFTLTSLDDERVVKDPTQVSKVGITLPPGAAPPRPPTLPGFSKKP